MPAFVDAVEKGGNTKGCVFTRLPPEAASLSRAEHADSPAAVPVSYEFTDDDSRAQR